MLYLKWFVFLILNIIMKYVVNLPLAPVIVLFAKQDGYLPGWLSWFQTADNSLDGDYGWQTENRPYLSESNKYQRWINRFHWLWRNSVYGFSRTVLGIDYQELRDSVFVDGDPNVSNGPPGKSGVVKRYLYRNQKLIAFQWYYIRQFKRWPDKCIRINIGWKLWGFGDPSISAADFVFSPSPWMHFS